MANCNDCHGSGKCAHCNGTGSWKKIDAHPSSGLVNPETGAVKCGVCLGRKRCQDCNGSGKIG